MSRVKEKASHFIAFFFSFSYSAPSGCYSSASENVSQKKVQSGFFYMVRESPENKPLRKPDFLCFVFEKPTASQDIVSKICHQTESTVLPYLRMNLIKNILGSQESQPLWNVILLHFKTGLTSNIQLNSPFFFCMKH